jgi:hypothetical protein
MTSNTRPVHTSPPISDSGRSTGGYLIFMQGGVVDATSTMPQLVAWSTCEAEYCMGALAAMGAFYIRKVYNELHGIDPDYQLTIPIGIDSQSAIDTAISYKETQRTRHFSRRFHFIASQRHHHKSSCSRSTAPPTVPTA